MLKYARPHGLAMPSGHTSELLYMPISVAPSTHGFDVIIHVPLFEPESKMMLYQHLPMPLPIEDGIFLMVDSPYDTIAISHDARKYRLTTITNLAAD